MFKRTALVAALLFIPAFICQRPALAQPEAKKPAAASAEAVTIKPKYAKGDKHKFHWRVERNNTMESMQQKGVDATVIDADLTLEVADVSESGYALDITIDSIKASNEAMGKTQAFDSSKPEDDKDRENETFLAFKPLVGMKLTLNADKNGVITGVSGDPANPQGRRVAEVAKQFFIVPDYLKFRWNVILNARRDGAASAPGESWKTVDVFVAPQVGKFEHTLTNTLKSAKDGVATIDGVGEMKLSPAKEGAPVAFEVKDTNILATSTWDLSSGLVRQLDMQRAFQLDGTAQSLPVKYRVDEKLSVKRAL